jgi:predicted RNA-binding Zn-ribbon protein involved in translation (DUF1610 family)
MIELTCQNKQCGHILHFKENKKVYVCPICQRNIYNMKKIVNMDNFLWIESMIKNIETYGTNTFQMIDQCYSNALTRAKVRDCYFQTIEQLKED